MAELISCIMPTKDRPGFLAQALACFGRQSDPNAELIVVDDGERPVEELCRGRERVRYLRLDRPTPTGTKLNLGMEAARGEILQKLDDDDYYANEFLATARAHLPGEDRDGVLVAWDCFLVLRAGERQLRYTGHGWRAGGTLCFPRSLWRRTPFRDIPKSSDSWFFRDAQPRHIRVCAPEQYILVRHGSNTWTLMADGQDADAFLGTLAIWPKTISDLVQPEERDFYETRLAVLNRRPPG